MGDPNNPITDSIAKILDAEPVKNEFAFSSHKGGRRASRHFCESGSFPCYRESQKYFHKVGKARAEHSLEAEAVKKVMPLLPLASMVSNDELREKWALLMESTAAEDGCLPGFGRTLSQLTVEEVPSHS